MTQTTDLANLAELSIATATTLQVFTTPQEVKAPMLAIEWRRRSTKQNPIAEANRYRAILVNEAAVTIAPSDCASKFAKLLQSTIHDLASKMLADELGETDKREVQAARYTINGIMAHWAEEKKRQTIDAAAITEWLKQSKTFASLNANQQTAWLTAMPKMAAPAYRNCLGSGDRGKAAAAVALSRLHADDTDNAVCQFLAERLGNIMSAEEADVADSL